MFFFKAGMTPPSPIPGSWEDDMSLVTSQCFPLPHRTPVQSWRILNTTRRTHPPPILPACLIMFEVLLADPLVEPLIHWWTVVLLACRPHPPAEAACGLPHQAG